MFARHALFSLVLLSSIVALEARALADPVLVEFTALDGAPLVAAGDDAVEPAAWVEGETRKRVAERAAAIARARLLLLASLPPDLAAAVTGDYRHFPLLRAEVDAAQRRALAAHPQVAAVHDDRQQALRTESSLAFMGASGWHGDGFEGAGTAVAVLDSGIRYWNGSFGDCPEPGAPGCTVLVFEGFANLAWGSGSTDPVEVAEQSDHGTNVGGIVAAVAPGTGLLSLGVFAWYDPDESTGFRGDVLANDGDVADALDWVIEHREEYNIVAANLSLGSEVDQSLTGHCSGWVVGAYESVFANCRDAGVLPVVASGNDFVKTAIAPPACVASAVAVAAGYDDPAFGYECGTGPVVPGAVVCFSDSNALVDLVAPGNDIDAGGIYGMSGTSMAAPHVAGLVALYQARYGTAPIWTLERMRVDAVPVTGIGPNQTYVHRSARVGDAEAVLTFDAGAVLASDFHGLHIPDGVDVPLLLAEEVVCDGPLCASGVAGHVYLDLNVEHTGTGDLVIELEAPDGTVARREVADDGELGLENVNSIIGSQHLPDAFEVLRGRPTEGTWTLRVWDDTRDREGALYRAVLLIDSARVELQGVVAVPDLEPPRPDGHFEVLVDLENRGNLDIDGAELALELVNASTGEVTASAELALELPMAPGQAVQLRPTLAGPQGAYDVRLTGSLSPPLAPGLVTEPQPLDITYRTFASFSVEPAAPTAGEPVQLRIISRGMVEGQRWDFGDGAIAEEASPVHAWAAPGTYAVSLVVSGPDGTSTTARSVTVVIAGAETPTWDVSGGGCDCAAAGSRPGAGALAPFALALLGLLGLRRRRRLRPLAPLALCLALAAGCWDDTPPATPDADTDGPPAGPWASLLDPPDPTIGDVTVHVMLSSEGSELCDLALEHREGDGAAAEWRAATVEGSLAGLRSGPDGVEHDLAWRSTLDVPGDAVDVRLRVLATCGGLEAPAVESAPFTVLNFFVNNPHAVLIAEVSAADDNVPADVNADYLELLNATGGEIALEGWRLVASGAAGGRTEHDLSGAVLAPGGRLVVAELGAQIEGALELDADLPWTVDAGGSVAVLASSDRGVDFVRWGGAATAPPAGLAWTDDPPLPVPQTLTVLARADEAVDGDRASDFCVAPPTPGRAGEGCTHGVEPSEVLITEVSSQGTDDQVEVLNASADTVNLGGWVLLWDGADLGEGKTPLAGIDILPGERIVLLDNGVAGDFRNGILWLGSNLNIDGLIPMALALQDPLGTIVDFVAGGGSRVRWVAWDEDAPTPMPGPETTLSRLPGDPDTDSAADFCLALPTPLEPAGACLEPLPLSLVISEVNTGRPDWVEIFNPGPDPADLDQVMVSYTSPYYGGSVGDYALYGTLEPGAVVVLTERELEEVPDAIVIDRQRTPGLQIAPEGAGSIAIRDVHGYGVDFVMWGEPPGGPPWPTAWNGLGADTHDAVDDISIDRRAVDAADTDTRDDWCWAAPSPGSPNEPCEEVDE